MGGNPTVKEGNSGTAVVAVGLGSFQTGGKYLNALKPGNTEIAFILPPPTLGYVWRVRGCPQWSGETILLVHK